MKLELFSEGDTVLLLGEGNFSFSVSLQRHRLPIKLIATCYESEPKFEHQLENSEYLRVNKVPVFFNVDATKIHENSNFSNVKFSKIICNFPHIGGKMKIHLNRELLREIFVSCSKIIAENGLLMISLCRGQGGTPADEPQRRWDDSWQVTEMAAHGDFVLTAVEPFLFENFPEYRCIGYRGRDVKFHSKGALVHVFSKREPFYVCANESLAVKRMSLVSLKQNVFAPVIYAELYKNNPISNPDSHISYLKHLLIKAFDRNSEWKYLSEDEVPVYFNQGSGVTCQVNSAKCTLRFSPLEILPDILAFLVDESFMSNFVLFPGMYFLPLGKDFLANAPVEFRFVVGGENTLVKTSKFLYSLIDLFQNKNIRLCQESPLENFYEGDIFSVNSLVGLKYENPKNNDHFTAALLCNLRYKGADLEISIINAQIICQYFFEIGWREIWAHKTKVVIDTKPTFKPSLLYPSKYKFDITLKHLEFYSEEQFYKILWFVAGQLIERVELVNEYSSVEGWSSRCYRITYGSLDKPLHRSRVIDIHSNIVGRALELGLNVTIG